MGIAATLLFCCLLSFVMSEKQKYPCVKQELLDVLGASVDVSNIVWVGDNNDGTVAWAGWAELLCIADHFWPSGGSTQKAHCHQSGRWQNSQSTIDCVPVCRKSDVDLAAEGFVYASTTGSWVNEVIGDSSSAGGNDDLVFASGYIQIQCAEGYVWSDDTIAPKRVMCVGAATWNYPSERCIRVCDISDLSVTVTNAETDVTMYTFTGHIPGLNVVKADGTAMVPCVDKYIWSDGSCITSVACLSNGQWDTASIAFTCEPVWPARTYEFCTSSSHHGATKYICELSSGWTYPYVGCQFGGHMSPIQENIADLAACRALCESTTNCVSVDYEEATDRCLLNSVTHEDSGSNIKEETPCQQSGGIFLDVLLYTEKCEDPCGGNPCVGDCVPTGPLFAPSHYTCCSMDITDNPSCAEPLTDKLGFIQTCNYADGSDYMNGIAVRYLIEAPEDQVIVVEWTGGADDELEEDMDYVVWYDSGAVVDALSHPACLWQNTLLDGYDGTPPPYASAHWTGVLSSDATFATPKTSTLNRVVIEICTTATTVAKGMQLEWHFEDA